MRHWKRRFAQLLAAALCIAVLAGCGGEEEGTALAVCVGGTPEELDPIYAMNPGDQTILNHLYENLMRLNVDMSGEPVVSYGMAKSAEQEKNYDGTVTWTFQLRSAKWSDGQDVQAEDFVYAWQRLADPSRQSPYRSMMSIVAGYDAVQETGDTTLLQVSAENDRTLVVVLNGEYEWFLSEVCTAVATLPLRRDLVQEEIGEEGDAAEEPAEPSRENTAWWRDPEGLVTNGPYQVQSYKSGTALELSTSKSYYDSEDIPQTMTFHFADTAEAALELYETGSVDFIGRLPEEQIAQMAQEESRFLVSELGAYSVLFNCGQEAFSDPAVRRAMGMVIDRNALAEAAGAAAQPAEGLIPPGVPESQETDFRTVGGALLDNEQEHYAELCQEAQRLLAEAGYEDGWGLGPWEYLYVEEGTNAAVAKALTATWRNVLKIPVTARGVSEEELEAALQEGTYLLAGVEIQAVGNDPECFLMQWGSASKGNVTRYANSAYDTLLSVIAGAEDDAARMGCLHDAEALLLEECAVAPLYTRQTAWALRDDLSGVFRDARGWFSLLSVASRSI